MLFISSKFIKVLMAFSLGLPFVANANDHLKPVNGFNRDMKQVDISKIDHEMFKVNFIYLIIANSIEECDKTAPKTSKKIARTGIQLFQENPEWPKTLDKTKLLWEEVNPLTNNSGNLNEVQINTLNMIASLTVLLGGNSLKLTDRQCSAFLQNIQDRPNQKLFWNNYIEKAIPVIIDTTQWRN